MITSELIEEARRIAALSPDSDAGKCFTELVSALEISVRENSDRKQSEGELVDMVNSLADERDALAAQVREARDVSTSWSVPVGVTETMHYRALLTRVHQTLSADPSVALDRVKAEAFAEGWAMRASRGYAHLKVGESVPLPGHVNPYWKGESNDQ